MKNIINYLLNYKLKEIFLFLNINYKDPNLLNKIWN